MAKMTRQNKEESYDKNSQSISNCSTSSLFCRPYEDVDPQKSEFVVSKKNLLLLRSDLCEHYQISLKSSPGKSVVKIELCVQQEDLKPVIQISPTEITFDGNNFSVP